MRLSWFHWFSVSVSVTLATITGQGSDARMNLYHQSNMFRIQQTETCLFPGRSVACANRAEIR
jgi:hypothetical protein